MKNIYIHDFFIEIYREDPLVLIDIGASGGIPLEWEKAERFLKIVGFEPDKRTSVYLPKNKGHIFLDIAVGRSNGESTFYSTKKQEVSSVFMPDYDFIKQFPDAERYEIEKVTKIKTVQLTTHLLEKAGINDVDFIKLDVQGGELPILQGAEELIHDFLFGIKVEVEFTPLYRQQYLFADVDNFLRSKGFQLFDLKRHYWKRKSGADIQMCKGQIIFADALYLKTYENFAYSLKRLAVKKQKSKFLKSISVCLVYGLYDYVLYLCDRAVADGFLNIEEKKLIYKQIYRGRMFPLKNKRIVYIFYRIARIAYSVYKCFETKTFSFSDFEIGNYR